MHRRPYYATRKGLGCYCSHDVTMLIMTLFAPNVALPRECVVSVPNSKMPSHASGGISPIFRVSCKRSLISPSNVGYMTFDAIAPVGNQEYTVWFWAFGPVYSVLYQRCQLSLVQTRCVETYKLCPPVVAVVVGPLSYPIGCTPPN